MSEEQPKKKKRRRRRGKPRNRQSDSQAQNQEASIYDEAQEAREIAAEQAKQEDRDQDADRLLRQVLPLILPKRDLEVMAWVQSVTGQSPVEVVTQVLRAAMVRERRAHREAMGGGGQSSTNLELLSRRI